MYFSRKLSKEHEKQTKKLEAMLSVPLLVPTPPEMQFREIEEIKTDNIGNENELCMEIYSSTTTTNAENEFIVQLPTWKTTQLLATFDFARRRLNE